jgi:hypothetical protein
MKSLLSIVLLAGLAFAQTTSAPKADQPKEEAKSGCCAPGASCCSDKDSGKANKDAAKKDGCCGGSSAGSMCHREPLKDKSSDKSPDQSSTPAPTTKN